MSERAWTTGPWKADKYGHRGPDGEYLEWTTDGPNMRLTALAPDMAENLIWLDQYLNGTNDKHFPGVSKALWKLLGNHLASTLSCMTDKLREIEAR